MIKAFRYFIILGITIWGILPVKVAGEGQKTIIVDPGHGGFFSGRNSEGVIELQIGFKLRDILTSRGYNAIMTRESSGIRYPNTASEYDEGIYKANFVNERKADVLIRLHSDYHTYDKFFMLYPHEQKNDSRGKVGPDDLNTIVKSRAFSESIHGSMLNHGFVSMPYGIAGESTLTKNMNTVISTHTSICTALGLIEIFGHGSVELMLKYSDPVQQEKVATAIADGIDAYFTRPESNLEPNYQPKPNIDMTPPKPSPPPVVVKPKPKPAAIAPPPPQANPVPEVPEPEIVKPKLRIENVKINNQNHPKIAQNIFINSKIKIKGEAPAGSQIKITVHSKTIEKTLTVPQSGQWEFDLNKVRLNSGKHQVDIIFPDRSGDSYTSSFNIKDVGIIESSKELLPKFLPNFLFTVVLSITMLCSLISFCWSSFLPSIKK